MRNTLTVGSLFSGIGGLDLGLEWAGFETKWFCEIEPFPQQVLKRHWQEVPIYEDVRTITTENAVPVDVIAGGFPCQDISWAGAGRGIDYDLSEQEGTRSGLWWEMWRVIRDLRPRYVIAENVSALAHRGLDIVLGSLAEIGYDAEWQIVSAASVGAPHIRERFFIVAYPQHGGVQVGRKVDDASGQTGGQGSVRQDDIGTGEQEKIREALAHADNPRLEGQPGNGFGVDKPRRESPRQDRQISGEGLQPDWFGGSVGQPHPVSFKVGDTEGEPGDGGGFYRLNKDREQESQPRNTGGPTGRWLEVEYDFRGMAYGVSDRVGALKGYGNAVVPQVGYLVGRAVMAHYIESIQKDA